MFITYDPITQTIASADDLELWANQNLLASYYDKLHEEYYDTELTGFEALFTYLNNDSVEGVTDLIDSEQLAKQIRLANTLLNTYNEDSFLDEFYSVGAFYDSEVLD